MGSILSCVGIVEVIRLVHLNGYVEEMNKPVKAAEVMRANPQHLVGHPCNFGIIRQTAVLPPEADLQLGEIYFLLPCNPYISHYSTLPLRSLSSINRSSSELQEGEMQPYLIHHGEDDDRHELFATVESPPTFRMQQYDGVTNFFMSRKCLADFLSGETLEIEKEEEEEACRKGDQQGHEREEMMRTRDIVHAEKEIKEKQQQEEEQQHERTRNRRSWSPCLPSIAEE